MPTIKDTWDQLDQEPIEIAWKELVDHKSFELTWRVEESRLAQEAEQDVGYVPKWLGGPGPSPGFVQRLCERRYNENPTHDLALARPEFLQELVSDLEKRHVFKWIDALFQTWRGQCTNGRESPEFLWAIFYKGVADEISKREALLSSGSLFVRACKYLESVRDRVELEAHKLQHVQFARREQGRPSQATITGTSGELEARKLEQLQARQGKKPSQQIIDRDRKRPQARRGKKPSQQIIDRDREMARLAFEGKSIDVIADYLDIQEFTTPSTWRKPKYAPKGEKYKTGIRVSQLRQSLHQMVSRAKRKYPALAPS